MKETKRSARGAPEDEEAVRRRSSASLLTITTRRLLYDAHQHVLQDKIINFSISFKCIRRPTAARRYHMGVSLSPYRRPVHYLIILLHDFPLSFKFERVRGCNFCSFSSCKNHRLEFFFLLKSCARTSFLSPAVSIDDS